MKIYEKIKLLRISKGMTQTQVSKNLFISQRAYSDVENGKTKLDIERLEMIAKIFEINISYFFESDISEDFYKTKIKQMEREIDFLRNLLNK